MECQRFLQSLQILYKRITWLVDDKHNLVTLATLICFRLILIPETSQPAGQGICRRKLSYDLEKFQKSPIPVRNPCNISTNSNPLDRHDRSQA